jgi:hypothetical protein
MIYDQERAQARLVFRWRHTGEDGGWLVGTCCRARLNVRRQLMSDQRSAYPGRRIARYPVAARRYFGAGFDASEGALSFRICCSWGMTVLIWACTIVLAWLIRAGVFATMAWPAGER